MNFLTEFFFDFRDKVKGAFKCDQRLSAANAGSSEVKFFKISQKIFGLAETQAVGFGLAFFQLGSWTIKTAAVAEVVDEQAGPFSSGADGTTGRQWAGVKFTALAS